MKYKTVFRRIDIFIWSTQGLEKEHEFVYFFELCTDPKFKVDPSFKLKNEKVYKKKWTEKISNCSLLSFHWLLCNII